MALEEEAGERGRSALAGAQEGSGVGLELGDVDGAALARRVLTSWLRRGGEGRAAVALLRGMGRVPCRLAASAAPGLVGSQRDVLRNPAMRSTRTAARFNPLLP